MDITKIRLAFLSIYNMSDTVNKTPKWKCSWKLSHIVCPLCGLSVPWSKFWRTINDPIEDIEAVSFRGLGRGLGWAKNDPISILDNERAMKYIVSRCRRLIETIEGPPVDAVFKEVQAEVQGLQNVIDRYEEDMDGLLTKICEVLSDVYDGAFADLESAVNALITEYSECLEESEDDVVDF